MDVIRATIYKMLAADSPYDYPSRFQVVLRLCNKMTRFRPRCQGDPPPSFNCSVNLPSSTAGACYRLQRVRRF